MISVSHCIWYIKHLHRAQYGRCFVQLHDVELNLVLDLRAIRVDMVCSNY